MPESIRNIGQEDGELLQPSIEDITCLQTIYPSGLREVVGKIIEIEFQSPDYGSQIRGSVNSAIKKQVNDSVDMNELLLSRLRVSHALRNLIGIPGTASYISRLSKNIEAEEKRIQQKGQGIVVPFTPGEYISTISHKLRLTAYPLEQTAFLYLFDNLLNIDPVLLERIKSELPANHIALSSVDLQIPFPASTFTIEKEPVNLARIISLVKSQFELMSAANPREIQADPNTSIFRPAVLAESNGLQLLAQMLGTNTRYNAEIDNPAIPKPVTWQDVAERSEKARQFIAHFSHMPEDRIFQGRVIGGSLLNISPTLILSVQPYSGEGKMSRPTTDHALQKDMRYFAQGISQRILSR